MIHNMNEALPETGNLTLEQVGEFKRQLERDVAAVVETWILRTGFYAVEATTKTARMDALNGKTQWVADLHVSATAKLGIG